MERAAALTTATKNHNGNPGLLSDIGVGFQAPEYIVERRTMSTRRAHTMLAETGGTPSTHAVYE